METRPTTRNKLGKSVGYGNPPNTMKNPPAKNPPAGFNPTRGFAFIGFIIL